MGIRIRSAALNVLNTRTRMPFRYGIATLTAIPHVFLRIELDVDGSRAFGVSSEGLPPKWFTKNPDEAFADEVRDMLAVIRSACGTALSIGGSDTVFSLWRELYSAQECWARGTDYPPLLRAFGVTLVERAVIDGFCRATGRTFADAVRTNALGIRLGDIHDELSGHAPADFLPTAPLRHIIVRHTVGLSDPLTEGDIPPAERINDGLPQSLEASIRAYGLTYFKIKLVGNPEKDRDRLERIASVMRAARPGDYAYTLDGNENYRHVTPFRELWNSLVADRALETFLKGLIFVEQPLHRDVALSEEVSDAKRSWEQRPPMIIDESDEALDSVRKALDSGYVGTSHKNCKGVFKGIANACLIRHRAKQNPGGRFVMSGEDLANIGPVALLEDLCVLATLGITHAERNGHHYFRGLSMFPEKVQAHVLSAHGDLYRPHERGFATLSIADGRIDVGSVVSAPFGPAFELATDQFTPLEEWEFASLERAQG